MSRVVIGLGGSGVQTVARLAARNRRVGVGDDVESNPVLALLAIDADHLQRQHPPLPEDASLGSNEFLLLTDGPVDLAVYLDAQIPFDGYLQGWWDERIAPGDLDGYSSIHRSRMVARLLFYSQSHRIADAITNTMQRAIVDELDRYPADGLVGRPVLNVALVLSACGTIGSAGIFDVLAAVHRAARSLGEDHLRVEIYLYLPGVFEWDVSQSPGFEQLLEAQQARAYACLSELDHLLANSDDFASFVSHEVGPEALPTGRHAELIARVWLFDAVAGGRGATKVAAFDSVADFVTSLPALWPEVMAPMAEPFWREWDQYRRRRSYGTFGLGTVVFPRDTINRHLRWRLIDWIVRDGLMAQSASLDGADLSVPDHATEELSRISGLCEHMWRDHRLVGRDRSPEHTTDVVPVDLRAAFEGSELVESLFTAIQHDERIVGESRGADRPSPSADFLSNLAFDWQDLRSTDPRVRSEASRGLLAELFELSDQLVVETALGGPRLAASLDHVLHQTHLPRDQVGELLDQARDRSGLVWCGWLAGAAQQIGDHVPGRFAGVVRPQPMTHLDHHLGLDVALGIRDVPSPDPDRLTFVTLEVAMPAWAANALSRCRPAYEREVKRFEADRFGTETCVHLDKRWGAGPHSLQPLTPPGAGTPSAGPGTDHDV